MSRIKVGDRVELTNTSKHELFPDFYPKPGTIGTVTEANNGILGVQWPDGSTSRDDRWLVADDDVRRVEE